ncbi:unnamed protein product [Lasius platythorax]|uniref:Uncharacterized protein n=1 Tax=Lasius platythorax TaxID=488582 RepID=A0AAV2N836_9HYME
MFGKPLTSLAFPVLKNPWAQDIAKRATFRKAGSNHHRNKIEISSILLKLAAAMMAAFVDSICVVIIARGKLSLNGNLEGLRNIH